MKFSQKNPIPMDGKSVQSALDIFSFGHRSFTPSSIVHYPLFMDDALSHQTPLRGSPTRIVLRVQGDLRAVVDDIRNQWTVFSGGQPFTSFFLDSRLDRYYERDRVVGTMLTILASLGLFISSLGLLGLAMYAIEQRTKELGIRKILGASILSMAGLLTKEFAKLVLIANFIAWPIAYFAMERWLDSFAYRIALGPGVFLIAGGIAMVIAMGTVGYHTARAAVRNPVESLRYE
jgi:putative ABC transport system permease protein